MNVTIYYRKHDGKWEYRLKWKDPITQKFREKSRRGFRTKPEAKKAAEKVQAKLQDGYILDDVSLVGFIDIWMNEYKIGNISKNYQLNLENSIKNHIKPYFQLMKLKDVTPEVYQRFLNYLYKEKNQARNTVLKSHNLLYNCFKQAVKNKRISSNPADDAVIPGERVQNNDELKYIDSDVYPLILEEALKDNYMYWLFFKVLFETGLRKGEAAALKRNDLFLNEEVPYIVIDETLDFQPKSNDIKDLFGDTKSRRKRKVFLAQTTVNALKKHLNWLNENKLVFKELYHHDLDLVLCRKDGSPFPKSTLFNAFNRYCDAVINRRYEIHSTRHTYTVVMLEAGNDLKFIQQQLGHGTSEITNQVYVHVSEKLKKKNIKQINERLNNVFK